MHIMKNTWKLFLPGLSAACLLYLCACGDEAPAPEKKQSAEKTEKTAAAPAPRARRRTRRTARP